MMIGIIGAMAQEVSLLASMINNPQKQIIAGVEFIQGELQGHQVVLLRSGVGKVQAAMATTLLHEHYKPSLIINIGSAGGLISGMEIGDIIISSESGHHDVDLSPIGLEPAVLPDLPKTFPSDPKLIALVEDALTELDINSKIGLIATGDTFIADQKQVAQIKAIFPNVLAVEMEAAAIAQVAHLYQTPFIVMRALSDLPDKEMPMSFVEYLDLAAKNSSQIVLKVLDKLPTEA
ncbi:5'-methylthioadenosine/S-adenosylhomocysteine nucleosidase [Ignatzschineria cameli]|uniref:5'-methylthioadenosine/S-adenosylhomocysteine nucleosidase n=1 Tax=Ignatzschineria cameli TaxID=2182793 RepID=UPI000D6045F1|nr:5'-methylthioadenosine/S-adenosylhomocysteine nucleosidase [Ignatzschineria cameli]PWD87530.1 5'-methylthioadenosine/S-adenosylhomocysteine nucleosidase [Ignatzschineria cameli]